MSRETLRSSGAGKARPIRALRGVPAVRGNAEFSRSRGVPRRLFDLDMPPGKGTPRAIAEAMLRRLSRTLDLSPDLADVKFDRLKKTLLGSHVLFQQQFGKSQISGAWLRVDIDPEGRVYNVQNDFVPQAAIKATLKETGGQLPAKPRSPVTEARIRGLALDAVKTKTGGDKRIADLELLYRPRDDGRPRLTWKAIVQSSRPTAEWKMYFDAVTGQLLWKRNVLKKATGRGRVFDPNPVVALNNTALHDRSKLPDAAYRIVALPDLAASGVLDGPYVSTRDTPQRTRRIRRAFLFRRGDAGFLETMVYFHIDRVQRHLQSLGFTGLLDRPIRVNVAGQRDDNSFYSPHSKALSFGTGGVDDAEDAEIILHEYGHALQDDQVPGWGDSPEAAAMGEGFGDFLAASFFADAKAQPLRPTVGSWDAVAYSAGDPPCLRRLDSNKQYPKDLHGEEHDDGEIWSACLWEIRSALGRLVTEKLVVAHHYLLNRWASFEDAANALLTTDRQLNGGRNAAALTAIFVRRGILPNPRRGNRRAGDPMEH